MYVIAYDLGTGGTKASLYDIKMQQKAHVFIEYGTEYPAEGWHEQKPDTWWNAVIESTRNLLNKSGVSPSEIRCVSLSGHSLVSVPIGSNGELLAEQVPIWSDTRATEEASLFFREISEDEWYLQTGNGFPPACYPIFKLMWMKKHQPEIYQKAKCFLGSKDYINFRLTGVFATDPSYASGSGMWLLRDNRFSEEYISAAGLDKQKLPPVVPSHTLIGNVTAEAAKQTGLKEGTAVACGGVDNACMAMGAVGAEEGRCYISLGSSAWIPMNSAEPILETEKRPYVFAHLAEGMYTSAFSIFSAGSALRWVRDTICSDFARQPDAYLQMDMLASKAEVGSGGVLFRPTLAGGNSQDRSPHLRGAFTGISLKTRREELIRSAMEGIVCNLYLSFRALSSHTEVSEPLLICGGGSKSRFWMQMFADVFDMEILKTNIEQEAASFGAAATAMRAIGVWKEYKEIGKIPRLEDRIKPDVKNQKVYKKLIRDFIYSGDLLCTLGDYQNRTR